MQLITKDDDLIIVEELRNPKSKNAIRFGIYFNLSQLHEESYGPYQEKIVINILNNTLNNYDGIISIFSNKDIAIIYQGNDIGVVDRVIFYIKNLFVDDLLSTHFDNEKFCKVFVLDYQWQDFYNLCIKKIDFLNKNDSSFLNNAHFNFKYDIEDEIKDADKLYLKTDSNKEDPKIQQDNSQIENCYNFFPRLYFDHFDVLKSIQNKAVYNLSLNNFENISCVFQELYVDIFTLKKTSKYDINLFINKNLFRYFTEKLDLEILKILTSKLEFKSQSTIMLNFNISTILTDQFVDFTQNILKANKSTIIIKINISDVFTDMNSYIRAQQYLKATGYRICLDILGNLSLLKIDKKTLGFDFLKLKLNDDNKKSLVESENIKLIESLKKYQENRIILSDCNTKDDIIYGKNLGIRLFQGSYLDKLANKI